MSTIVTQNTDHTVKVRDTLIDNFDVSVNNSTNLLKIYYDSIKSRCRE